MTVPGDGGDGGDREDRGDLAATGIDPGVTWIVALGMIALGGGLVALRRIRARKSSL